MFNKYFDRSGRRRAGHAGRHGGKRRRARRHQEEGCAGRGHQGRLPSVRLPRSVGQDRRFRARSRRRRGQAARREAGAGPRGRVQSHPVPATRQDRHDDRDDERPRRNGGRSSTSSSRTTTASGTNVLAPKTAGLKNWEALRARRCASSRARSTTRSCRRNTASTESPSPASAEAFAALRNGNCVAFAYDDTAIVGEMQKPEWSAYEMPLDSILFQPWGLAVKQGEKAFADMMSKTAAEWHKSGFIRSSKRSGASSPPSSPRKCATSSNSGLGRRHGGSGRRRPPSATIPARRSNRPMESFWPGLPGCTMQPASISRSSTTRLTAAASSAAF